MAVQVVAVGGCRPETVETYRRVLRHSLRDLSGAVLTCPGMLTSSKNRPAGYALPRSHVVSVPFFVVRMGYGRSDLTADKSRRNVSTASDNSSLTAAQFSSLAC